MATDLKSMLIELRGVKESEGEGKCEVGRDERRERRREGGCVCERGRVREESSEGKRREECRFVERVLFLRFSRRKRSRRNVQGVSRVSWASPVPEKMKRFLRARED